MSAECFTRPQYVSRSYRDAGKSLLPGRDADIFFTSLSPCLASLYASARPCLYGAQMKSQCGGVESDMATEITRFISGKCLAFQPQILPTSSFSSNHDRILV